jgi:hypothetical protein
VYGSALDAAFNELLKPCRDVCPEDIFIQEFSRTKINNLEVEVRSNINFTYAAADFDSDLVEISDEDIIQMGVLKTKKAKYGLSSLTKEERLFFNAWHWECLKVKGLLMIRAYKEKVLPLVKKVYDVQIPIELSNGEDTITGYVDLVADVEGHGLVVLDNKTSSIEYAKDSVLTSPQLSLYLSALQEKYNTRKAGYIVLSKRVKKNKVKVCKKCGYDGTSGRHSSCPKEIQNRRCGGQWEETIAPEIEIQIIIDEIPKRTEDIVIENYDNICHAIQNKIFTRNMTTCGNIYGSPCAYFGLCYKNSMKGLEEVE